VAALRNLDNNAHALTLRINRRVCGRAGSAEPLKRSGGERTSGTKIALLVDEAQRERRQLESGGEGQTRAEHGVDL
jgi:hypothetical protein